MSSLPPVDGEFDLCLNRVGNLSRKCQVQKLFCPAPNSRSCVSEWLAKTWLNKL